MRSGCGAANRGKSVLCGDANFGVFSVAYVAAKHNHPVLLRLTEVRACQSWPRAAFRRLDRRKAGPRAIARPTADASYLSSSMGVMKQPMAFVRATGAGRP